MNGLHIFNVDGELTVLHAQHRSPEEVAALSGEFPGVGRAQVGVQLASCHG